MTPLKIKTYPGALGSRETTYPTETYEEGKTESYRGAANSAIHNSTRQASSYLSRSHSSIQSLRGANYEVYLPVDYLHMLNCVCIYYVAKQKDCYDAGSYIEIPATRLTADSWSQIITDIYNRPSPMKPYYYIHNENQSNTVPTNPYTPSSSVGTKDAISGTLSEESQLSGTKDAITAKDLVGTGTDMSNIYKVTQMNGSEDLDKAYSADGKEIKGQKEDVSNFQRTFKLDGGTQVSLVEKPTAMRFGNTSNVRCEIRYGK